LDVVNEDDLVIDRKSRGQCLKEGLLHRAIAVLLFDEQGRLYIQRRAEGMRWYPDYWTLSVMGHVSSGETYEDAAEREVAEELGIDCQLKVVGRVETPEWRYDAMIEREFLSVFEGRVANPKIVLSEETREGRFVGFEELVEMTKQESEKFTPDTLLALQVYLEAKDSKSRLQLP